MPPPNNLPRQVRAAHRDWAAELVQAPYMYATWRLRSGHGTRYVKVAFTGAYPSLLAEADRMRWAIRHLPVPEVVDAGEEDGVEWLVTEEIPGIDATKLTDDPASVVRALGEGLRRFHEAPTDDCPFDFTLDAALEHCAERVRTVKEQWADLHGDFKHLTPEQVLQELFVKRPDSEDIVVCHGDYCFPNALLTDGTVTGYLDLGELGLADRWWDIAVGAWSVTWNVDPKWEPLFYDAYGVQPDPDRIRYYRMMYDLAS